ncbi:MAG TPA: N-acetylglucosamine-6-phosphate deacetylase [Xanthobacteraceae bacterium]|jgi:N-acetylglucosamine-6-phosphate deacetylase
MTGKVPHAISASHVFDGSVLHKDAAIVIEGERIAALLPRAELSRSTDDLILPDGLWIAPGFIDVQVNGGGDVLFNDAPTAEGLAAIAAAHRKFGTTGLLPTLITDAPEKMQAALAAVQAARAGQPGILGIHLEGPFISPERAGVHVIRHIRAPSAADSEMLGARGAGVMLVTLAPEQVPAGFIAELVSMGIRVSLGHSAASYRQTRAAMAEGLAGFTHLFNAMPPLLSRDPGPIAAALESPSASYGLIVDGIHVDPAVLRLALRGAGHPLLVTDAMPPVGGAQTSFRLYGEEIGVRDGRCLRRDGTLAGTVLDMASAVRNCVRMLEAPLERALGFASLNPANFLGLGSELGRIAAGFRADLVAFEPEEVQVVRTWVAGRSVP